MSGIEWTGYTWNPVTGCDKVSAGCKHCYAGRLAETRLKHLARYRDGFFGNVQLHEGELGKMLRKRKVPNNMVFVNSMSDLFHEAVSFEFIDKVFAVMALRPDLVFQILTKRPERMREYMTRSGIPCESFMDAMSVVSAALPDVVVPTSLAVDGSWRLDNVWLGVSVEDQATAEARVVRLIETPAAVRFVSYEPALGPVNWRKNIRPSAADGRPMWPCGESLLFGLDWVIVGGESGPGARPFDVAWARETVDACREARRACFVKQLGSNPVRYVGGLGASGEGQVEYSIQLRDKKGGDPSEWPEDLRVREWPQAVGEKSTFDEQPFS